MAEVSLEHIFKRYKGTTKPAVEDVSFTVNDGEFMVLLGPSGCGKSTTLRMIAGLESISEGVLSIGSSQMNTVAAKDRDLSMVFQSYALYPHMTVADNLAFGLRRRRIPSADITKRVNAAAEVLGLSEYLGRKPFALSGGQRQRVALGRAIVREPKAFLFDEPLSNLDAALRVKTRNELVRLHRQLGATMIYVTHDQVEAMTMGQRICVMNNGRVAQIGKPLDVYRQPADAFVARFLGNPPMNVLKAKIGRSNNCLIACLESGNLPLSRWNGQHLPDSGAILVGMRPEEITIIQSSDAESGTLRGIVSGVEPLGAETLLQVDLQGGDEVTVRMHRNVVAKIGEQIGLHVPASAVYLFDAVTEKAINANEVYQE